MATKLSITESEWQVMQIIWNDSPQALQEILEKLKQTEWSKTTIQTYLARLVKKGALSTQRQGKGYLYYPAISQNDCQLEESKNFLSRVYGGSLSRMVSGFIQSGDLSDNELNALKELIMEQEGK